MAMTPTADIIRAMVGHRRELDAVRQQVNGDPAALDSAGWAETVCARGTEGAAGEMAAARAALEASWAAPSGAAFQTRSEPLPDGIAAAQRLLAGLGAGLLDLGTALSQVQGQVDTIRREFALWTSTMQQVLMSAPEHPVEVFQRVHANGELNVNAARAAARQLDAALERFGHTVAPLAGELAAARPVTP